MTTAKTGSVDIAVRTQVEYFGAGRYDLAGQMVTQDYVDHEAPPGTPPGPEGANAVLRWLRGAFADLSYEICDAFGDADRTAVRLITRGTHTGEFMGTPPTGKQFEIEAIHLYRIQDGKVAEHWAKRDDVGLATQLGLFGH
ncbi:MAG TPA: ester cyclase [Streptosporangiaceae bacterium]